MKYILLAFILSQIFMVPFIMFVDKNMNKLHINNKFRLWWKRNISDDVYNNKNKN